MQNTKVALAVLSAFALVTVIQLIYYFLIYGKFTFHRKKSAVSFKEVPMSVVVVVRDNASQILQSLPKLLSQQYPAFEIVVVNDRSPDENTLFTIKEYSNRYPNIKFVDLSEAVSTSKGRKMAVSFGIKCATYENILVTSPDCEPSSVHWLSAMAANFQGQKKVVVGYSTYARRRTPYNAFLRYDNVVGAVQYFSHVLRNATYRADFNNIAFLRQLFYNQKGFTSFNHLEWGEEDIFVHRISGGDNTSVEYSPESMIVQNNIPSYGYWRSHKISLYYTRKFNSTRNRFSLSMFDATNMLFYVLLTLSVVSAIHVPTFLYAAIGVAVVRVVGLYVSVGISAAKLCEKQIIPLILPFDLLFSVLNPLYFIYSRLNTKKYA